MATKKKNTRPTPPRILAEDVTPYVNRLAALLSADKGLSEQSPLYVMVGREQKDRFEAFAKSRNMRMRELVTIAVEEFISRREQEQERQSSGLLSPSSMVSAAAGKSETARNAEPQGVSMIDLAWLQRSVTQMQSRTAAIEDLLAEVGKQVEAVVAKQADREWKANIEASVQELYDEVHNVATYDNYVPRFRARMSKS